MVVFEPRVPRRRSLRRIAVLTIEAAVNVLLIYALALIIADSGSFIVDVAPYVEGR